MELREIEDKIARNEMSASQVFTQMKQHINQKKGKGIPYKGLIIQTEVSNFYAGREAFTSGLPEDCHEGDPAEVDYVVTGLEIDCEKTLIKALELESDEDLGDLVIADIEGQ